MRRFLECIYVGSGWIAAGFLTLICSIVLLQVGCNVVIAWADWAFGLKLKLMVPSYAEFAGYFFIAAAFFGLGYTHHTRAHVRVSLLLERLNGRSRVALEIWCVAVAAMFAAFFTYNAFALMLTSFEYGDMSGGLVPIPLWIPQLSMACGLLVLTISLFDDFVCIAFGSASKTWSPRFADKHCELPETFEIAPVEGGVRQTDYIPSAPAAQ